MALPYLLISKAGKDPHGSVREITSALHSATVLRVPLKRRNRDHARCSRVADATIETGHGDDNMLPTLANGVRKAPRVRAAMLLVVG